MVFVTGGTGLVGSHLLRELLHKGVGVRALYHNRPPLGDLTEGIEWVEGDILDIDSLYRFIEGAEHVYHCASYISYDKKKKAILEHINVEGAANVVNACIEKGVKKLCYIGSVAGLTKKNKSTGEINEETDWDNPLIESYYGRSKYLGELEVWRGVAEGLRAVVLNPSIVLGAGDWTTGSTKIFKTVYDGFPWYTNGATGFVDVCDVVKAALLLMDNEGIYNKRFILNAVNMGYKDIFGLIADGFGKPRPNRYAPPILGHLVRIVKSISCKINHTEPLLTVETVNKSYSRVCYDNSKLLDVLSGFSYRPIEETVFRVCGELMDYYR